MTPEKITVLAPKGIPPAMVTDYIDKCRTGLLALRTAVNESEYEVLRFSGHRLKGTGSAYGFPPLTTIGASLEQAAIGRNRKELLSQVGALEEYLSLVEVVFA